ncbi:MAG: hypothetical protein B6I36_04585 [Desulfobacteraceae bacterium 4572_35.1]|nr:MAG: hypothetical protein B6I36_04585 [Desulfobacteraceae bacterium 4572_35.1]
MRGKIKLFILLLLHYYVPETLGAKLRQHKINYLDGVGNGSIQDETFFYEISGRKKKTPQVLPNRTQQVAGTKIIYQLLKNPQLCDKPYRTIAQQAQVALGAVGPVIKELHKKNLLADDVDGTRRVAHATALRQLWEAAYLGRLRPKLQLERCELSSPWHTDNLPLLIKEQNLEDQVVVGGEMAASFYCEHSHVRTAVLHLAESTALKQMLQLRLIPCTDGPITIVNQFSLNDAFEQRSAEGLLLADPRLVRCELLYDERLQDVKYTNLASQIEQEYLLGTEQLYEG